MRVVAYSRARSALSYKTFSYLFYDDPDFDLTIGGKYANDGLNVTKGFAGYLLEMRIYSTEMLSLDALDQQLDWECTANTAQKFCEFCPMYITSSINYCLEDLLTGRVNTNYLKARYDFTGTPVGGNTARRYYRSTYNGNSYDFYFGNARPDVRIVDREPHRSEANGLFFDGDDYIS